MAAGTALPSRLLRKGEGSQVRAGVLAYAKTGNSWESMCRNGSKTCSGDIGAQAGLILTGYRWQDRYLEATVGMVLKGCSWQYMGQRPRSCSSVIQVGCSWQGMWQRSGRCSAADSVNHSGGAQVWGLSVQLSQFCGPQWWGSGTALERTVRLGTGLRAPWNWGKSSRVPQCQYSVISVSHWLPCYLLLKPFTTEWLSIVCYVYSKCTYLNA